MQIGDDDRLNQIKGELYSAFCSEYPKSKFMTLWIADLLDSLKIDKDYIKDIAISLHSKASELKAIGNYHSARSYLSWHQKNSSNALMKVVGWSL